MKILLSIITVCLFSTPAIAQVATDFISWRDCFINKELCADSSNDGVINFYDFIFFRHWLISQPSPQPQQCSITAEYNFKRVRVEGGGFVTGCDQAPDGTMVCRSDVYGAYALEPDGKWRQLVTASSMPVEDVHVEKATSVTEIAIAPSSTCRWYMISLGYVYRSDDCGHIWQRTAFERATYDLGARSRLYGQKLAAGIGNPDRIWAGTETELWLSNDAGATWAVRNLPEGLITGILVSPTQVWVAVGTHGVFKTFNSVNWEQISSDTLGGPVNVVQSARSGSTYYYTEVSGKVWRWDGSWTDITPRAGIASHAITIDPFNPNRIVVGTNAGRLNISRDRGDTWDAEINYITRIAEDVPWIAADPDNHQPWMSTAEMRFDTQTVGKLWFAEGAGVFWAMLDDGPMTEVTWNSQTEGIYEIVPNVIVAPTNGGKPVFVNWDFPLMYIEDPDEPYTGPWGPDGVFNFGWAASAAASDQNFLVAVVTDARQIAWITGDDHASASSNDGGKTWTKFPSTPLGTVNAWDWGYGTIAAATPTSWVWVPSRNKQPYYTMDAGVTWHPVMLPGWSGSFFPDMHNWHYLNRHTIVADPVEIGTYYLYWRSWNNNDPIGGLWRSLDYGQTWTLAHNGVIAPWSIFNAQLTATPGRIGHLLLTPGGSSTPDSIGGAPFGDAARSTDGGLTWSIIPRIKEVYSFGYGPALTEGGYPAIYMSGYLDGEYGIYRSDDETATWVRIGTYPLGWYPLAKAVAGDWSTPGKVYVALAGAGFVIGECQN